MVTRGTITRLLCIQFPRRYSKDQRMEVKENLHVKLLSNEEGDGSVICFRNVTYAIDRVSLTKKLPPKIILKNVSGIMKVGLNAIMGPTGSGKSSLLDILADRKARNGLSGNILINGKRQPHNFKCASAYVVQNDVVIGTLTVQENLSFSALLWLPMSYTWKERKDKVNTMISDLKLRKVADSLVGTEILRGISGGERKRTAIGMELIISPQFVFLDEPTSGMDTTTAMSIISLLKDLSAAGRVIVLAIHQPCYPIFKFFDSLTILYNGEIVYHGPTANALNYFARIGYQCEKHDNPADFFLDVISTSKTSEAPNLFTTAFKKSQEHQEIQMILDPLVTKALHEPRGTTPQYITYFPWQVMMVAIRTTLNIIRDPLLALMQLFIMALCGILAGIIFYNVDHSFDGVQSSIESRKIDGTTFLDDQQFNQNPIWINLLALLMITLVSLIGTYAALRLMKKGK